MNEKELQWAYERVEAMADGTLTRDERRRMHAAVARDDALAQAVARARTLRAALRDLGQAPVPRGLLGRLLRVPSAPASAGARASAARRAPFNRAFIALPVAAALAVALVLVVSRPPAQEDPRAAAIRDFNVAMAYLQKSAAHTSEEVGGIVSTGIFGAVLTARDSISNEDEENGG